jgi:alpha-N-acetylglucosamine transferase
MDKRPRKKGQVGMEFMIIAGALIFFCALFLLAVQNRQEERVYQRQIIQLKEIALTVQNEINLASESTEGYIREFEIPTTAGSQEYEINLTQGSIYIKTTNDKHALSLPIPEVEGNINKTYNLIKKINGTVYLNQ